MICPHDKHNQHIALRDNNNYFTLRAVTILISIGYKHAANSDWHYLRYVIQTDSGFHARKSDVILRTTRKELCRLTFHISFSNNFFYRSLNQNKSVFSENFNFEF